jgi:hypothetical protein
MDFDDAKILTLRQMANNLLREMLNANRLCHFYRLREILIISWVNNP